VLACRRINIGKSCNFPRRQRERAMSTPADRAHRNFSRADLGLARKQGFWWPVLIGGHFEAEAKTVSAPQRIFSAQCVIPYHARIAVPPH